MRPYSNKKYVQGMDYGKKSLGISRVGMTTSRVVSRRVSYGVHNFLIEISLSLHRASKHLVEYEEV
jgi:hypothetical protein